MNVRLNCLSVTSLVVLLMVFYLINVRFLVKRVSMDLPPISKFSPHYKWYNSLRKFQQVTCVEVCQTSAQHEKVFSLRKKPGKVKSFWEKDLEKNFDCRKLWRDEFIDAPGHHKEAPKEIPLSVRGDYTYQGRAKLADYYINEIADVQGRTWSKKMIDDMVISYRKGELSGSYGKHRVDQISKIIKEEQMPVSQKKILVIGTQQPWIEAILVAEGAEVTTLEYNPIKSEHPNIRTVMPQEMAQLVEYSLSHNIYFDGVITFSSLEHSGLGRYGDQLNPWGDLVTMARAWCVVAPGGRALVGVPAAASDVVCMNAHRKYGPVMFSHLFASWNLVWSEIKNLSQEGSTNCYDWGYQPITVLEKPQ